MELWDAVKEYAEGLEHVTLSTLLAVHQNMNVINCGPPGQGKSHLTKTLCDKLGIKYILVAGHKSPKEFFNVFKNKGLIIVDESATLIRNPKIMDMLLSALWDSQVEWSNNRKQEKIIFEGNIIFNTNSIPNSPFMDALKDRCIYNDVKLTEKQLKKIWKKIKEHKKGEFEEAWKIIISNLNNDTELTIAEVDSINELIDRLRYKSLRTPLKIHKIARFLKSVFGNVDKINVFVKEDAIHKIMLSKVKHSKKIKQIAKLRKVTTRQASNILKKYETLYNNIK